MRKTPWSLVDDNGGATAPNKIVSASLCGVNSSSSISQKKLIVHHIFSYFPHQGVVLKYGLAVLGSPACGDSVGGQEVKDVARQATWIYAEVANGSCRSLVEKVLLKHAELSQPPKATIIGIKFGQHPKRKPQKPAIFKGWDLGIHRHPLVLSNWSQSRGSAGLGTR